MDPVILVFAAIIVIVWSYTLAMRQALKKHHILTRQYTKQLYVAWVFTIVSIVFILTRLIPTQT